ncbi:MAG: hypothetical protein AB8B87_19040 [Granulosicoccus sp.]
MRPVFRIAACLSGLFIVACSGGGSGDGNPDTTEMSSTPSPEGMGSVDPSEDDPPQVIPAQIDPPQITPAEDDPALIIPTDEAKPYRDSSPYNAVLSRCALASSDEPCTLGTLPYIGQTTPRPTVDDILDRTVVTHSWMGDRLGELLRASPKDVTKLFQPVTAILIGSDVRPSSFRGSTGVIRLDPDYLWQTVEEKRTISLDEDYRSNYGSDLKFVSLWRSMIGDDYAFNFYSLEDDEERELSDIVPRSLRLLYHELAHANDAVSPDSMSTLTNDMTPRSVVDALFEQRISIQLYESAELGLDRSWLFALAAIRYRDEEPSEFLASVRSEYVGGEMGNEGMARFYGYSSIYEDVATLFDQAMMKHHFGIDTHVGFADKPSGYPDDTSCNDLKVGWGVRNRIASPLVVPRARWVAEQVLDGLSVEMQQFFDNDIGEETFLRNGDGWCESRFSDPVVATARQRNTISGQEQLRRELEMFRDH